MRTFLCEAWVIISILSVVAAILGLVFKDALEDLSGFIVGLATVAIIVSAVTYYGSTEVINVIGMDKNNAIQTLQETGLKTDFNQENTSSTITTQSVTGGKWVKNGTVIYLNYNGETPPPPPPEPPEEDSGSQDVVSENIISIDGDFVKGQLNDNILQKKYKILPAVTGNHRFEFETDNRNNVFKFILKDSKGNELKRLNSDIKGTTAELSAGQTYYITLDREKGNPDYTLYVWRPNQRTKIQGREIRGSIRYIDQEDIFEYTSPISGIYAMHFGISDVTQYYNYSIYDSKNSRVKNGNSAIKQSSFELVAGETYTITISHEKGFVDYNISLGVPNEIKTISYGETTGSISYYKQENCYLFTPTYSGEHHMQMYIDDVKKYYSYKIVDDVNSTVKRGTSAIKETKFDLVAGKTYKIYILYDEDVCNYKFNIS